MAAVNRDPDTRDERTGGANQYLTFTLANEEYGVEIMKVQEIKVYTAATRLPNSPPGVVGVLNLRGAIVPIVDLRTKFGLDAIEYNQFTAVIVVVVQGRVMGVIVDSVSDVVAIPVANIQPPPEFSGARTPMLLGIATLGDHLVTLLDIDALLMEECIGSPLAA